MTSRQLIRSVARTGSGTTLSGAGLIRFLALERDYMNEADKIEICSRCKEARINSGLTEPEMADMLEPSVTDRTIRNYESDRPPFRYLRQWAEITGTEYLWLLRGDEGAATAVVAVDPDLRNHLEELRETVDRQGEATIQTLEDLTAQIQRILGLLEPPAESTTAEPD